MSGRSAPAGRFLTLARVVRMYFTAERRSAVRVRTCVRSLVDSVHDNGQIVGSYSDSNNVEHGFLYSHGNFVASTWTTGTECSSSGRKRLRWC